MFCLLFLLILMNLTSWFALTLVYIQLGLYIYLDTDTIFIISALYATRIELKWHNQDEIEVQTLSFN